MEYLFVLSDKGGWWLKIDSVKQLEDYHKKTDEARYEATLDRILHGEAPYELLEKTPDMKERIRLMEDPSFKFLQAAYLKAGQLNCSVLDGVRAFKIEAGMHELSLIKQSGAVYFNPSGGCTGDISYTQFCRRTELIFPGFTEKDLRFVRYPNGGRHWYAFAGNMQIRDGMRNKWNTREEAERVAKKMLKAQGTI